MLARVMLALAVVVLEPAVVARRAAAAEPPAPSAPESSNSVPLRGWEWGLGAAVGRRSGWWSPLPPTSPGFDWVIEASLLRVLGERAVVGAMLSSGSAIEMLAGVRFRLSPAHRLDLLADAGFTHLSLSESYMAPTVGARAGLAWARRGSGRYRYVTVGVAVRHRVPDRTVPLYCDSPAVPCGTVALGGGTLVGAFVTWSLHVGDST